MPIEIVEEFPDGSVPDVDSPEHHERWTKLAEMLRKRYHHPVAEKNENHVVVYYVPGNSSPTKFEFNTLLPYLKIRKQINMHMVFLFPAGCANCGDRYLAHLKSKDPTKPAKCLFGPGHWADGPPWTDKWSDD